MNDAREHARLTVSHYFRTRELQPPGESATEFLRTTKCLGGRWLNPGRLDDARNILRTSLINVDDLAENFLGLTLEFDHLSGLDLIADAPVFGVAYPETRRIVICERATEYEPLYRATVMHEVAHCLLHSGTRARVLAYSPASRIRPAYERQADAFMVECLLPRPVLALGILYAIEVLEQAPALALSGANTGRGQWFWRGSVRQVAHIG